MARVNSSYETIFVIDVQLGEEGIPQMVEKFKTLISESAELTEVNEWGKRRLAYPINDRTEGYYVYAVFNSSPDFPADLKRVYNITEGIIRSVVVKLDK